MIQGSFLHLVKHIFPIFLSFILHGSSSVLKMIICSAPKALLSPKSGAILPSAGQCRSIKFGALVDCQLHLLCGGEGNSHKYHPFQGFNALENVLTSLKAAVLAPAAIMVDTKKCNCPFLCHKFQLNYLITVPSLDSIKKESSRANKKILESYKIRENQVTVNWTCISLYFLTTMKLQRIR